jgi:hypothetical protein
MCRRYPVDKWGVKYIIENWTRQYNLQALPVFGLGISAGASFVLRLPKITRVNGIVSGGAGRGTREVGGSDAMSPMGVQLPVCTSAYPCRSCQVYRLPFCCPLADLHASAPPLTFQLCLLPLPNHSPFPTTHPASLPACHCCRRRGAGCNLRDVSG